MIANFGYKDGSGDYYIIIDTDKCNGCRDCVPVCPAGLLEVRDNEFDPMADEQMALVKDEFRKKIKYSCAPCKPDNVVKSLPCVKACKYDAIAHSW
jgi:Fe-S-cluster-containing hydrogenase component 2